MKWTLGAIALAYFLGSIPFGLLLTKIAKVGDIRQIGSGNIGATNVLRSGHKGLALLTLLLDAAKGYAAVYATWFMYNDDYALLGGLFAVIGHVFPLWLRFKGGKGVATTFGVLFALNVPLAVFTGALWLLVFFFMRYSSLAAIMSIGYSGIIAYLLDDPMSGLLCLNLAVLILYTHRSNIRRLLSGTEPRFRETAA